ncbi:MAG TPA: Ivy family c-type lysozyme inhibitor [Terriglobales bacterium]|nr:Ivy family c-type lysozyme inhibitor [Terriglobales bacterium]
MRRWAAAAACLLMGALAAGAQERLDRETMRLFGGTYLSDCRNNSSPRITVFDSALVFIAGNNRVASNNVQASYSYFGNSAPENYKVAFQGDMPDNAQMIAIVYVDRAGDYIKLDGDRPVQAAVGRANLALKYRRCRASATALGGATKDANSASTPGASGAAPSRGPAPRYALDQLTAPGLLQDRKAKAAYYRALGPLTRVPWLAQLDGPSPQNRKVVVAGKEYILAGACKNHDCADNNVLILYHEPLGVVYGKVFSGRRDMLIGRPPMLLAIEIEKLWRQQWRQGQ